MKTKTKNKPNEIDIVIAKNLKKIRKLRQISQHDLGTESGVSFQQIQKYENAKNKISASRLALLADALDVSILYFYPKKHHNIMERFLKRLLIDMDY